jgi:hypothetical protein
MRCLIAFLAAVALLVNPVAAAAAQVACDRGGMAMAGMDPPQADAARPGDGHEMTAAPAAPDPCCDHSARQKTDDKTCAQACAAACAVLVGLPYSPTGQGLTWTRVSAPVAATVRPRTHDPSGPERPPKAIL